jgi:hypothetical protein
MPCVKRNKKEMHEANHLLSSCVDRVAEACPGHEGDAFVHPGWPFNFIGSKRIHPVIMKKTALVDGIPKRKSLEPQAGHLHRSIPRYDYI